MANLVAIELNHDLLLVAAAKSSGRGYQITDAFSVDFAPDSTDSQISERLKEALLRRGIVRPETICVVNRQDVEIREISVPPAPDNELPEMVRFQARNEFASLNDSWSLDYVPFDGIEGGPRRVLATAISPQLTGRLKAIVESAGMKLKRILFRPYALCDLLEKKLSDGKARLIVDPNEDQIDLTITIGQDLNATRSLRKHKTADQGAQIRQLLGEVKRTLASSSSALAGRSIDEILICGSPDDYQTLAHQLTERFDYPIGFVDPVRNVPNHSFEVHDLPPQIERFASLLGALIQEHSRLGHRVDFLHPRRRVVKKIDHKRTTLYGAVAACVALFIVLFGWWVLRSQARQLDALNQQLAELQAQNDGQNGRPGVDQIIGEVGKIDQWRVWDIDWLNELAEISDRFLTPDDAIIDHFTTELGNGNALILLKGRMSEIGSGTELSSHLAARPYSVKSGRTVRLAEEDNDYQMSYEKNLFLEIDPELAIRRINELARQQLSGNTTKPDEAANVNNAGAE